MRSFQLLCRLRSFVVSAKITLTCFFALFGLAVFVLGTAHGPALAQYPGGGYPGGGGSGGSSGGYPGAGTDAGYYGLATYSGGTVTAVNGQTTPFAQVDSENYQGSGTASAGTDPSTGAAQSCSVSASGPLTAKFQWKPNDPADTSTPTNAIVVQTASVSWSAPVGTANTSGSIDPGTGNPVPPPTDPYSQSWTDSKYTVESGGSTVSVSMTPLASFGGGTVANKYDSYLYGNAKITYKAHVYVPFIDFGTSVNASKQALTGQQIGAHLNTNGAPITIHSYTWSSSGGTNGNPIKNWDPNGKAADGVTPQQLFPLTDADLTGTDTSTAQTGITVADLNFYDQAADTVTVKCVVNFTFPKDSKGNAKSGSVTVTAKPINFLKPKATNWGIKSGIVRSPNGVTGLFNVPGDTVYMDGQSWHDVVINVPSQFPGGQFSFAQTLTSNRTVYRELPQGSTASAYYVQTNNGVNGLDTIFPYFTPFTIPNQPANKELAGDSPQVAVPGYNVTITVPSSDTGGTNWNKTTASDQFTTWLIYMPPGQNSIWVPLQNYSWSWSGTMMYDAGWTQTAGNPTAGGTPTASDTNTPPSWTIVHSASDAFKSP